MFEKLDGIIERYDEIMEQLNDPNVVSDQSNFRKLMKEQSDLAPIVELYRKYMEIKKNNKLENKGDVLVKNGKQSLNIEILGK